MAIKVKENSQNTLTKLYELLDFNKSENLVSESSLPQDMFQRMFFEEAKNKLKIESIFFYKPPNGGVSIPYIYFYRLSGQDQTQISKNLSELHRLAWNMGRAPILFAALPDGQVKILNTYSYPEEYKGKDYTAGLIDVLNIFSEAEKARQYHRHEFESGHFWQNNNIRFDPKKRADYSLLENLKYMRRQLMDLLLNDMKLDLASDIIHRLLGRSIFIKYLEDRKDSKGKNVFPDGFWGDNANGFLDILTSKIETYKIFEKLNQKFNGDLFPVSNDESNYIQENHLEKLRSYLSGKEDIRTGQLHLWKFYSFDIIPIEFISKIYEEFFHIHEKEKKIIKDGRQIDRSVETGTHYTPHYLVEFLVDEVFPWNGTKTNYKILDPACGSGIFLVELYRRLIAHWIQANKNKKIQFDDLKELLVRNIFGVDSNSGAIHVTAFSLYLTLCDFLEPRQIWEDVTFPKLRNNNLHNSDFFDTTQNSNKQNKYDLIIGNPPWKSELSEKAKQYCLDNQDKYPERQFAPDNQIAITFLWHAPNICKQTGEICLLMPSKGLLFNRSTTHKIFRRDFFSSYNIKTIINFSAYRHFLFEKSTGPASAVIFSPENPDMNVPVLYCSPKPTYTVEDNLQFTILHQDISQIPRKESIESDIIWKVAMWGTPRDYELIKKLLSYQTLEDICNEKNLIHAEGFIVGNQKYSAPWIYKKPYLDVRHFKRFIIDVKNLPLYEKDKFKDPKSGKREIFKGPHLLIKQSPRVGESSFSAAVLKEDAVFRDSIVGIHAHHEELNLLAQCCVFLNSRVPLYFALMVSRRLLIERDELNKEEIMNFPIPNNAFEIPITYNDIKKLSTDLHWTNKIQNMVEPYYNLNQNEIFLIEDAINYTLDYFRMKSKSKAFLPTQTNKDDFILRQYVDLIQKTIQNSFGKKFKPIIFQSQNASAPISLRIICLKLLENDDYLNDIFIEKSPVALNHTLNEINNFLIENRSPSVFIQRIARVFIGNTIYIIKPDQQRFWTKSIALKDADEIYSDIMEYWRS